MNRIFKLQATYGGRMRMKETEKIKEKERKKGKKRKQGIECHPIGKQRRGRKNLIINCGLIYTFLELSFFFSLSGSIE